MPTPVSQRRLNLLLACLVILAGFGLRVHRLDQSDIGWDEAWAVVLARLPPAESLQQTASDEHPPLYYWLLAGWRQLAGETLFALRLPSAFAGVLALPVLYRIGRRLNGPSLGLFAALLLALNLFQIVWAQQTKMYTAASLFSLASFWCLLAWLGPGQRRRAALGYGLTALAAALTHYISLLIILAQGLAGVWWGLEQSFAHRQTGRRWLTGWLGLNGVVVAVLAAWGWYLVYAAPHTTFVAPPLMSGPAYVQVVAMVLTLGVTTEFARHAWFVLASVLVGLGWLPHLGARQPVQRVGSRALLLLLLLPLTLIYQLASIRSADLFAPKFDSRYVLILTPLAMLSLAWGLQGWLRLARRDLRRGLGLVLAGLIVLVQLRLLPPYYQFRTQTADFVTLMRTLSHVAHPGDGVVVYTDLDWPIFAYYNAARLAWTGIPSRANLTAAEVAARIDTSVAAHSATWVVISPDAIQLDPNHAILTAVSRHYPLAADLSFGRYRLQLYTAEVRRLTELSAPVRPSVALEAPIPSVPGLRLIGYDLPLREVWPGDYFPVSLYWETPAQMSGLFWRVQLLDNHGALQRQGGGELAAGANYVTTDLPISAAWAGGQYHLQLVVTSGDSAGSSGPAAALTIPLATIRVQNGQPPVGGATRFDHFVGARFGQTILLEGNSALPDRLQPGETLSLTLFWRAQRETRKNYTVFVHLVGSEINLATNNFLWGQVDQEPLGGRSPTSSWFVGHGLSDRYAILLSPDAPAGNYRVEVGLYDHSSGARLPVTIAGGDSADYIDLGRFSVP